MQFKSYFYSCSKGYLDAISSALQSEIIQVVSNLPKRDTQSELNKDLFWLLTANGWSYDSVPAVLGDLPPQDLPLEKVSLAEIRRRNHRGLCLTATTLETRWHSDFAKSYEDQLVQIEAQFGKVESMFKDFCGFKIGRYERRLALGIEIVMCEPSKYFSHRRKATSGMAYFDIAKKTLPSIGLDCPIWLVGIKD